MVIGNPCSERRPRGLPGLRQPESHVASGHSRTQCVSVADDSEKFPGELLCGGNAVHSPLDILKGHLLVGPRRDIRLEKRDAVLGTYWELFPSIADLIEVQIYNGIRQATDR